MKRESYWRIFLANLGISLVFVALVLIARSTFNSKTEPGWNWLLLYCVMVWMMNVSREHGKRKALGAVCHVEDLKVGATYRVHSRFSSCHLFVERVNPYEDGYRLLELEQPIPDEFVRFKIAKGTAGEKVLKQIDR